MGEPPPPGLANSSVLLAIALKCAVAVSVFEAPILLTESIDIAIVFSAGWLIIFACTLYRAWRLHTFSLLNDEMSVIKFVGSLVATALATGALYLTLMSLSSAAANDPIWQLKAAFISNMFAALDAATVATFATLLVKQIYAFASGRKP